MRDLKHSAGTQNTETESSEGAHTHTHTHHNSPEPCPPPRPPSPRQEERGWHTLRGRYTSKHGPALAGMLGTNNEMQSVSAGAGHCRLGQEEQREGITEGALDSQPQETRRRNRNGKASRQDISKKGRMEPGVERDPSASVFRTSDITPRARPRRTPPLRGRLGVKGASILTRCPEPETYQVNRHKMIRLRPWGSEWLAPQPHLVPHPRYHSFLLPQPRPFPQWPEHRHRFGHI